MNMRVWAAGFALLALMGCSEQTQQKVEDTGKAVASEVKENAKEAVEVTKEAASGAELTASVKSALMASDKMDTTSLNVDTVDGAVHLRGSVPTDEQRTLAEEITKNTVAAGTNVVNELTVGAANATATPVVSGTPVVEGTPVGVVTPTVDGTPIPGATPTAVDDHAGHDHPEGEHTH